MSRLDTKCYDQEIDDRKRAANLGMSYKDFVARREFLLKQAEELDAEPQSTAAQHR